MGSCLLFYILPCNSNREKLSYNTKVTYAGHPPAYFVAFCFMLSVLWLYGCVSVLACLMPYESIFRDCGIACKVFSASCQQLALFAVGGMSICCKMSASWGSRLDRS